MNKVIHPFDTLIGKRFAPVFIKIEIKNKDKGKVLSISGVEGPLQSGNCRWLGTTPANSRRIAWPRYRKKESWSARGS